MAIFDLSRRWPPEERYSLTDQVRRSSRSICANLAEAWQKRNYPMAFLAKLSDSRAEARETLVWIEFAHRCGYLKAATAAQLRSEYGVVLGQIVRMLQHPENWVLPNDTRSS